jgi:hypothetical protein
MTSEQALVATLGPQLDVRSDNESLLDDATLDARSVYEDTIRLVKHGVDWDAVPDRVADTVDLKKRDTARRGQGTQRDGELLRVRRRRSPEPYERWRVPASGERRGRVHRVAHRRRQSRVPHQHEPYKHVTGVLDGGDAHLDVLETALGIDEWKIGDRAASTPVRPGIPNLLARVGKCAVCPQKRLPPGLRNGCCTSAPTPA